ncbi:MAG: nitroreductase family protein [Anaerolineae bacterium]
MDYQELIAQRYSVRAYEHRDIEPEKLQRVLQAFAMAPTAANKQPLGLIVVQTRGRESDLKRIYSAEWFSSQAPVVLVGCIVPAQAWQRRDGRNYADVDVAIAMDHLILAATAEGLGTCWIGAFDLAAARDVLALPEGVEPVVMTPLGYPADSPRPKLRKKMEQLIHQERW